MRFEQQQQLAGGRLDGLQGKGGFIAHHLGTDDQGEAEGTQQAVEDLLEAGRFWRNISRDERTPDEIRDGIGAKMAQRIGSLLVAGRIVIHLLAGTAIFIEPIADGFAVILGLGTQPQENPAAKSEQDGRQEKDFWEPSFLGGSHGDDLSR